MPSGEGERSRHQLMAASTSVMWMAAIARSGAGKDTCFTARPRVVPPCKRGPAAADLALHEVVFIVARDERRDVAGARAAGTGAGAGVPGRVVRARAGGGR